MQWLRLYTEIRSDRKLRRLPPSQRWLWIILLVLARESPQPGKLLLSESVPITNEDLADFAAIPLDEVEKGIKAFLEQNMITIDECGVYFLNNWSKRQFNSDDSTERVKRYRGRQSEQCNVFETFHNRYNTVTVTPPDTDTDTDTDIKYSCASVHDAHSCDKEPENDQIAGQDLDSHAANGVSDTDVEANKVTVVSGYNPAEKSSEQLRRPFKSITQQRRFDSFWVKYPKKRSKGQAEKAWVKINPDEELFQRILYGLELAKSSGDWQKDGGQFIPYPSSWLNAKGWEDEYKEVVGSGGKRKRFESLYES